MDEVARTVELMSTFLRRHVVEQAGARIKLSESPRHVQLGRRMRFRVRAWLGGARQPLAGATVSILGRRARTDRRGRAVVTATPRRVELVKARATRATLAAGVKSVRVLARRPAR